MKEKRKIGEKMKKVEEQGEVMKSVALEKEILDKMMDLKYSPERLKNHIEEALWRCVKTGIHMSEKMERNRNLDSGSRFLDKFARQQAYGTCMGSGDDMYYVEKVFEYFKQQVPMWREFEKRVREDEKKNPQGKKAK
jgi:hypothetical protein